MNQQPDYSNNPQLRHNAGLPDTLGASVNSSNDSGSEHRDDPISPPYDGTVNVAHAHELLLSVRGMLQETVIGQRRVIDDLLVAATAGGHVLVEGVPGLGKTLLVRCLAQCIAGSFNRVQFTPDLMPSDIVGHAMFDADTQQFSIRRGPVFANFIVADEINRAPAKTQAALLEAMQEQQVSIEGETMALPSPFMVLATQNPIEQEGTYPLPQAQLDRFLTKLLIDYPDEQDEIDMLRLTTNGHVGDKLDISRIKTVMQASDLVALQRSAATIHVDDAVAAYIVELVRSTRAWNGIDVGAGPRASIAMLRAARAQALLNGHDFVTPDDVKSIAPGVLRHRIALSADLEIEGYQTDDVVRDLLEQIAAPRQ
jgi:MoxR-like ATPase